MTDTPDTMTTADHRRAYSQALHSHKAAADAHATDDGAARRLHEQARAVGSAGQRLGRAAEAERRDHNDRPVLVALWQLHVRAHEAECHTRRGTRHGYHANPLRCGCLQQRPPRVRQALVAGFDRYCAAVAAERAADTEAVPA